MKRIMVLMLVFLFSGYLYAGNKDKGEKCFSNAECKYTLQCKGSVCVKEKKFDFGSSGKAGNSCNIDADCIGSGKCVQGKFGKKYCSGK